MKKNSYNFILSNKHVLNYWKRVTYSWKLIYEFSRLTRFLVMQDTAPRLIPSLIEMLNTGYDEICEVQLYNLHCIHVCWFQGCCLMHASLPALHLSYEWGQLNFCSRSPSGHLDMEFSFPSNQYMFTSFLCNQKLQAIPDCPFALSSKKIFPINKPANHFNNFVN